VLLAVAETAVPFGELVQAGPQMLLVGDEAPMVSLGGAVLTGRGTGPALRDPETFLQAPVNREEMAGDVATVQPVETRHCLAARRASVSERRPFAPSRQTVACSPTLAAMAQEWAVASIEVLLHGGRVSPLP